MATTLTTENLFDGTSSQQTFTITFPYLQQADVKVEHPIGTILSSGYTFLNATQIQFTTTETGTNNVRIYRDTNVDSAKAVYATGSTMRAIDLNNNEEQLLFAVQEKSYTPHIAADAVTSTEIRDNTIVNANVSNSAEIEVAKLKDGAARQLLQTDAGGTSVEWTSNVKVPGTFQSVGAAQFDSSITCNTPVTLSGTVATGALTTTGNIVVSGTVDGRDIAADGAKLDSIESGSKGDQTGSEIKSAYEAESNTNALTDALLSKLNGIEASATADQSNAEIRAAVEAANDSNVFTDADHTKLNAIEASATADQTGAEIKAAYEGEDNTNAFTDDDHTKLDGIEAGAEVNVQSDWNSSSGDNQILNKPTLVSGINDLSDVDTTGVANDKILKYVAADSKWKVADDGGSGGGGSGEANQNAFSNIAVSGQDTVAADTATDTLTIVGGTNVTVTTDASADSVTITASGGEVTVQDEGVSLSTAATTLNFVGAGVTASGTGATKTITISGGGGAVTTDFQYLELKAHNNASGAFSAGAADYELVTKGTTTAVDPGQAAALMISIAGVLQEPNTGTSIGSNDGFCVDGSSIHFGANLTAHPEYILWLKGAGSHTIADDSIAEAKLDIHNAPSGTDKYLKYTSNGMEWATAGSGTPEGTAVLSTGETGTAKFLRVDGDNSCSWQVPPDTNTTYSVVDSSANGLAPQLPGSHGGKFLKADGTWEVPPDTNTQLTLVDEDNMASNSATSVPSQQSVKAYVDNNAGTTINNATANELVTVASTTTQLDAESSLTFQDTATTGLISGRQITGRGFECPAEITADWTIAAANNAMFPGPMGIANGVVVTVPSSRTLTIV